MNTLQDVKAWFLATNAVPNWVSSLVGVVLAVAVLSHC